jgi:hypothetical protein
MKRMRAARRACLQATVGRLSAVAFSFLLAGCAAAEGTAVEGDPGSVVAAARADAAQRSGLSPAQIELVSLRSVTWSDGSLGCPQPGMAYTQALVPGYRILLRAGAQTWHYHASLRGRPVPCPPGQAREPLPSNRD